MAFWLPGCLRPVWPPVRAWHSRERSRPDWQRVSHFLCRRWWWWSALAIRFSAKSLGVVFVSVIGRVLLGWGKLLCPPRASTTFFSIGRVNLAAENCSPANSCQLCQRVTMVFPWDGKGKWATKHHRCAAAPPTFIITNNTIFV